MRIVAHDLDEAVERDGRTLDGTVLELAPAYAPPQLDDVLSGSDVLLVPSVMRESHSLVTREALLRQVPVVTTDTLGPEEVVQDGVNGLIVPAGDPGLLRAALESLTRPRRRPTSPSWGRAAGVGARARPTSSMASRPATPPWWPPPRSPSPPSLARVLFVVGIDGAPLRYRAQLPAEALGLLGVGTDIRHYRDPDVPGLAASADAVVVYRVPATPQVLELIERTRATGTPVVFDVDDLIFDPEHPGGDPRAAAAATGRGGAVARGGPALPHHHGALRRLHRLHGRI